MFNCHMMIINVCLWRKQQSRQNKLGVLWQKLTWSVEKLNNTREYRSVCECESPVVYLHQRNKNNKNEWINFTEYEKEPGQFLWTHTKSGQMDECEVKEKCTTDKNEPVQHEFELNTMTTEKKTRSQDKCIRMLTTKRVACKPVKVVPETHIRITQKEN